MNSEYNLLWTGGWDSTFRLLFSLLIEKRRINLIYIYDHQRRSRNIELKRMKKILRQIKKKYPKFSDNILKFIVIQKKSIVRINEIDIMYSRLKKKYHIGKQYRWLASFRKLKKIEELELSIEKYIEDDISIGSILSLNVKGKGHDCKLKKILTDKNLLLFEGFRFPTIHLTKKDMELLAIKYNFISIMYMTWFCHSPKFKRIPCGSCRPCNVAVENGLMNKLPLLSQYFYFKEHYEKSNIFKFLKFKKAYSIKYH